MGEENGIGPAGYRSMDFDQVLETVGDSGAYQVTLFLLISVMEFVAIDSFAINFLAARMDHWCHVAELNNRSFDEQLMLAVPPRTADGVVATTGYSHCLRYDPISPTWNEFAEAAFNGSDNVTMSATVADRSTVRCDDGWTYDRSSFVSTIVSEWDLVCDRAWLVDLVSAVYMIGRLVASMSCGPIADRFGRKRTVLGFHVVKMAGSVLSLYAPNYTVFIISRFIIAVGSTASNLATFIIVTEISGRRYRSAFGIGWSMMLAVGTVVMPGIAYLVRDWRMLQSIYTWPQIVLLAYFFLLDESPRWLTVKCRVKEASAILQKIAAVNRRQLPDDIVVEVPKSVAQTSPERRSRRCQCGILKLVSTPKLRKCSLILWLNWFTGSLMYYALSLNAGRLPGDIFLNMFLLAVVEIPANILAVPLLERVGRRLTLGVSTLSAGISSLLMIPFMYINGADNAVTAFGVLGKALITTAYSSAYIVTSETYPTEVRAVGMGVSTSFARFSSLFASFIGGILAEKWKPLPSVIFGVLGLVSGSLVFLLQETRNQNLTSTVAEAENLNRPDTVELTVDPSQPNHLTDPEADVKVHSLLGNGHVEANYVNHEQDDQVPAASNGGNAVPLLGQAA